MSAEAERSDANGHSNGTAVLERVKEAREKAVRVGQKPPGRDALVKTLGIRPWQAQKALKELKENPSTSPSAASAPAPAEDHAEGPGDEPISGTPSDPQPPALSTPPRPWPLLLIGFAAAVAVWSGWVGLGAKCGFGIIQPLPGIVDDFTLNTAITLPISVEAYAAYALRVWLSNSHHSARTITFAKWSTILSLVIGAAAQGGYHLLEAFSYDRAPWPVVLVVSWVPVVMVGVASGLAKLVKDDRQVGVSQ